MLNAILQFSLRQRLLVFASALLMSGYGVWTALKLPIDVFPDLDRPRVVIMTESSEMAPEETETRVTFPIETAMNGANGVQAVRSTSSVGLSIIYVELALEPMFTPHGRSSTNVSPWLLADCLRMPSRNWHLSPLSWGKSWFSACGARMVRQIRSSFERKRTGL